MAFLQYYPDEEDKNQNAGSGVIAGNPNQANQSSGSQTTGSGFVNLQRYLDANKGQAGGLADVVVGGGDEKIDTFKKDANKIAEEAKNAYSSAARSGEADQITQGLTSDPVSAVNNAKGYLDSTYDAKDAKSYYEPLAQRKSEIGNRLENIDDRYTQQALLKREFNKDGNYTSGFGALDTFLLGADPTSRQRIQSAQARTSELAPAYETAQGAIDQAYQTGSSDFTSNQDRIRKTAGDQYRQRSRSYETEAEKAARERNRVLDEERAALEYYIQKNSKYRDVDPNNLITDAGRYGRDQFITDEQFAELEALNSLVDPQNPLGYDRTQRDYDVGVNADAVKAATMADTMIGGPDGNRLVPMWDEFEYDPVTNQFRERSTYENEDGSVSDNAWRESAYNARKDFVDYMLSKGFTPEEIGI